MLTRASTLSLAITLALGLTACLTSSEDYQAMYAFAHDRDDDGVWGPQAEGPDCDDWDPRAYPGADEFCNGKDDDCDGAIDEAAVDTWVVWVDADGDGFGETGNWTLKCERPEGWAWEDGDCDDADPEVNPDAEEICDNGVDDDCDGGRGACRWSGVTAIDEAADATFYGEAEHDVPTAMAVPGDLSGDGLPDLLIASSRFGDRGQGALYGVFAPFDSSMSLDASEIRLLGPTETLVGEFGESIAALGDLDRDDHPDIAVLARGAVEYTPTVASAVYLYRGPLTAVNSPEDAYLRISDPDGPIMDSVQAIGDQTGDGRPDLIITSTNADTRVSRGGLVAVFKSTWPGQRSLEDSEAFIFGDVEDLQVGHDVTPVGDTNGDGIDDLLLGVSGVTSTIGQTGYAGLFQGPMEGDYFLEDATLQWEGDGEYDAVGWSVGRLADVDGDGLSDFVITDSGYQENTLLGRLHVMSGAERSGGVPRSHAMCTFVGPYYELRSPSVGAANLDDDEHLELIVGGPSSIRDVVFAGAVLVLSMEQCGEGSLIETPDALEAAWTGVSTQEALGTEILIHDMTQDGEADLLIRAPGAKDQGDLTLGAVYLLNGIGL